MQTFKTFFKKEIFAEFMIPARPSANVVIICSGVPGVPTKRSLMEFFARKGYWAFHVRYRGSWESKGVFLKKPLNQDLIDVIDELPKGFSDLWSKKKYKIHPKKIILTGSSFGGPAVIFASQDPRVTKAIAVSPVVDWRAPSKDEPLPQFVRFMKEAYGQAYRGDNWKKLGTGFYEPTGKENGSKLMIVHAKDDEVVGLKEVRKFALQIGATLHILKRGGHLSSSAIMKPVLWKKIKKFLL